MPFLADATIRKMGLEKVDRSQYYNPELNLEIGFDPGVEVSRIILAEGYSDYMVAYRAESPGVAGNRLRPPLQGTGASPRAGHPHPEADSRPSRRCA
jgi:hypothetical protein